MTKAARYLELVNAEDTHKAGPGERGGKHGLVHEDGTKCDAAKIDGCPEERKSSDADKGLSKYAIRMAKMTPEEIATFLAKERAYRHKPEVRAKLAARKREKRANMSIEERAAENEARRVSYRVKMDKQRAMRKPEGGSVSNSALVGYASEKDLVRDAYKRAREYNGDEKIGHTASLGATGDFDRQEYPRKELADAIRETGMNPNRFAKVSGIEANEVYGMLRGKSPLTRQKVSPGSSKEYIWSESASKVAALLDKDPKELFPEEARLVGRVIDLRRGVDSERIPSKETERDDVYGVMKALLRTLPVRHRKVMEMRYGLNGKPPMTLEDTGRVLGITRERVRQIEATSLRHLRHPAKMKYLNDYLDICIDDGWYRQPARQVGIEREETVDSAAGVKGAKK